MEEPISSLKIFDFHTGRNSSEGSEFPSPGGVAKIQRIFDGVVKKNIHISQQPLAMTSWWLREPQSPIEFKCTKKAPIKPELMLYFEIKFQL